MVMNEGKAIYTVMPPKIRTRRCNSISQHHFKTCLRTQSFKLLVAVLHLVQRPPSTQKFPRRTPCSSCMRSRAHDLSRPEKLLLRPMLLLSPLLREQVRLHPSPSKDHCCSRERRSASCDTADRVV